MRNTYLRVVQLTTGVLVAVFSGIHVVIMHLNNILVFFGVDSADPTAWEPMIGRAQQGVWVGLYIALLVFGLFHALYGLRNIILELAPSAGTMRVVNGIIIVLGILFFIGGTYVPVALLTR